MKPLDGNVLAGIFSEIFAVEMTTAIGRCAGCGNSWALGAARVYLDGASSTIRCPDCDARWGAVIKDSDGLTLSLSGITTLLIPRTAL